MLLVPVYSCAHLIAASHHGIVPSCVSPLTFLSPTFVVTSFCNAKMPKHQGLRIMMLVILLGETVVTRTHDKHKHLLTLLAPHSRHGKQTLGVRLGSVLGVRNGLTLTPLRLESENMWEK